MPIFDNELLGNTTPLIEEDLLPKVPIESPGKREVDTSMGGSPLNFQQNGSQGMTIDQLSQLALTPTDMGTFSSPVGTLSRQELLDNKRYPMYQRGVDLENIYGLQQSSWEQWGNSIAKFVTTTGGTFAQSFTNLPNLINAAQERDFSKLSGDPNGYEGGIADFMKNMNDVFPNYYSRQEKENPYLAMIPFAPGSANFWGDKILVNAGFTAGSILGAVAQDLVVGAVTEGIGSIPLVAGQIGRLALYLNKVFAGTNKLDKVLDVAAGLGKTEQQLMNITNLARLAQAAKVNTGVKYGMALLGTSMTESKVESIDSYKTLVEDLTNEYKFQNLGKEPGFEDAQQIEKLATDAMNTRFGINMALLTVSNAIQLDNVLKSFTSAQKGLTSTFTKQLQDAGKIGLKEGSLDVFEKKAAATMVGKVWDVVKPNASYFLREGVFEEGGQYATERGVYDYYSRKYKNLANPEYKKNWNSLNETMSSVSQGLADQFGTDAGIESMIVGGISGVLQGGVMGAVDRARGQGKDVRLQSAINILNLHGMTGILSDKYDNTLETVNIAKEMEDAAKSGNIYQYKNLKHRNFFNFVQSRLGADMHDVTVEQLNMLKDLPQEEFEKQFGMDFSESNKKTVNEYVNSLINEANNIKDNYEAIDSTFKNPFTKYANPKDDDEVLETDRSRTFDKWKKELTFYASIKNDVNSRLASIQTEINGMVPGLSVDSLTQYFDKDSITELRQYYNTSAENLEKSITDLTAPLDKKRITKQAKDLRDASKLIDNALANGIDDATLSKLLNFDLNGQDFSKDNVVPVEDVNQLMKYGIDADKLKFQNQRASDIFDGLSTKEGFEKFFKQEKEVQDEINKAIENAVAEQEILNRETLASDKTADELEQDFLTEQEEKQQAYDKELEKIAKQVENRRSDEAYQARQKELEQAFDEAPTLGETNEDQSFIYNGKEGRLVYDEEAGYQFNERGTDRYVDLGTKNAATPLYEVGIKKSALPSPIENIEVTPAGDFINITVNGKTYKNAYSNPLNAINYGPDGNVVSVELVGDKGRVSFKKYADEIAYSILLYTYEKLNNENKRNAEELAERIAKFATPGEEQSTVATDTTEGERAEQQTQAEELGQEAEQELDDAIGIDEDILLANLISAETTQDLLKAYNELSPEQQEKYKEFFTAAKDFLKVKDKTFVETIAEKQEIIDKMGETITQEQDGFEKESGDVSTDNPVIDAARVPKEAPKKDWKILFGSTTAPADSPSTATPHGDRAIHFFNNAKDFANRPYLRAILVTANQETAFGLEGLVQLATDETSTDPVTGGVIAVFVEQDGNDLFFINKDGERIGKLREVVSLNDVVFQTMPSAELYWKSTGDIRYRQDQEAEATGARDQWEDMRVGLFNAPASDNPSAYPFDISRGIAKTSDEQNNVGETLVDENEISTNRNLITIPTTGGISHNGQIYSYPNGRPLLTYQDIVQFLDNRNLSDNQAETVFTLLQNMFNEFDTALEAGVQNPKLNKSYIRFIQNILYWKRGDEQLNNQVYINGKTMEFHIGGDRFPLINLDRDKDALIARLKQAFHNVNNFRLKNQFDDKFIEYYMIDGKLSNSEWTNYQTYLLSSKYPNGSARLAKDTPLTTNVVKTSEAVPYNFRQKYAVLNGIEFSGPQAQPVAPAVVTPAPVAEAADDKFNGTTPQTYTVGKGDIEFTATLEGDSINLQTLPNSKVNDSTFAKAVADRELFTKQIIPYLQDIEKYREQSPNESVEDYEKALAAEFYANYVGVKILQERAAEKAAAVEAPVAEVVVEEAPVVKPKFEVFGNNVLHTEDGSIAEEYNSPEEAKEGLKEWLAIDGPIDTSNTDAPSDDYRRVADGETGGLTKTEIELFKNWAAENLPLMPYQFLDHMIKTFDNQQAWGVLEKGVAKIFKGALRGTEYHESFHFVFNGFLTGAEQQGLYDEFRRQEGTFIDRASGKRLNYSDATDKQIEERLADDFADFRLGKLPAKSLQEKVLRFFKSILDFFKNMVNKPSKKQELFKAIDTGKFKDRVPSESIKGVPALYSMRTINGLNAEQVEGYVNDMKARVGGIVSKDNKSLFTFNNDTVGSIFNQIKADYVKERKMQLLDSIGADTFNKLQERTIESLRTLRITIDNDSNISVTDDSVNRTDYASEPFTVDVKRMADFSVKLAVGTLLETEESGQGNSSLKLPSAKINKLVQGFKLLNFSKAFGTLINKLSNSNDVNALLDKLATLAKNDSSYVRMMRRLRGDENNRGNKINFEKLTKDDWRFLVKFYTTFNKQNPTAYVQKIDGEQVYTRSANAALAARETERQWISNMIGLSKEPNSMIGRDNLNESYKVIAREINVKSPVEQIQYLNDMGITFSLNEYNKLDREQLNTFNTAFLAIYDTLKKNPQVVNLKGNTLQLGGQFAKLAELFVNATNPLIDSTYYGVNGKKKQSFTDNNAPSYFENAFNSVKNIQQLYALIPNLNDVISTNSQVLKQGGLFFDQTGKRTATQLKVGYIDGVDNLGTNKSTRTADLTEAQRFNTEINQNVNGNYYILIPADSTTEWMMNLGSFINFARFNEVVDGVNMGKSDTLVAFRGYLFDDIKLAKDYKRRGKLNNVGNKAKQLRFFNDILTPTMVKNITEELIDTNATDTEIETFITQNINAIDGSVQSYINGIVNETRGILQSNNSIIDVVKPDGLYYSYLALDDDFSKNENVSINKNALSEDELLNVLTYARTNAIMANIEYHKILFGDPFQFEVKDKKGKKILDETKRVKSFLSGRMITVDFPEFNTALDKDYNVVDGIRLQPGDPGYQAFRPFANTTTFLESISGSELANLGKNFEGYAKSKEADASSIIMINAFKQVKLKIGQWGDDAEQWYQWQSAYARQKMSEKGDYKYSEDARGNALAKHDAKLIDTDEPTFKLEILKPIVSGNKYDKDYIDLVLDKFSQMPIYYKAVEGTNLEKMFVKMHKGDIDYAIMQSGRKVGIEGMHPIYNGRGEFNAEAFNNLIQVPWTSYGIQVDNQYYEGGGLRQGSQLTKNATIDLYSDGVAESPKAEKLYKQNNAILKEQKQHAYRTLLKKFGIKDLGTSFFAPNKIAISKALKDEMLKRGLDNNTIVSITVDENGQFIIPFEASNSYKQIKDILYSIVHSTIVAPTVSGSASVQAPAMLWENAEEGRTLLRKKDDKWVKISRDEYDQLTDAEKAKVVLGSDTLKFYTKGEKATGLMEIMLPHWFKNKFDKERFPTDKSILDYLNKNDEGKNILRGIGFRIPNQALSATEAFTIKGFLPQSMGKTVVVPSEIVTKAGSDFDVDKLNMYLKAVYVDRDGNVKLVKYKGSEQATKDFYGKEFDAILEAKKDKKEKSLLQTLKDIDIIDAIIYNEDSTNPDENLEERLLKNRKKLDKLIADNGDIFEDAADFLEGIAVDLRQGLSKLNDAALQSALKDIYVDRMYKQALENAYYDNLQDIVTLPSNFERLVTPNDDTTLSDLADAIDDLTGESAAELAAKNRMINPNFLTKLRNMFVEAKAWVGIGAVNITSHSLFQKAKTYIDPNNFYKLGYGEQKRLGDGTIVLPHNTVEVDGEKRISLGARVDRAGKLISLKLSSYVNAFVDVAKDPYIMKIIRSKRVVGTFMFLERAGVPTAYVAMFMNQPIIREYLKQLDSNNVTGLFDKRQLDVIKQLFPAEKFEYARAVKEGMKPIVTPSALQSNIATYYTKRKTNQFLTKKENLEQRLVLDEFLKYATMAQHLTSFMQALSYDTTKFRSVESKYKKEQRTQDARDNNIISSIDSVVKDSFIGDIIDALDNMNNAFGDADILRFNKPEFKKIYLDQVLRPYARNKYMSDDDYEAVANKLSASFLDYIIQTNVDNLNIESLLVDQTTSIGKQLAIAKKNFPNLQILQDLYVRTDGGINATESLALAANLKEPYDQNVYTGYMRELRDNPETNELFNNIVKVAILQGT